MGLPKLVRSKPPLPPGAERRRFERFELLAQVELRMRGEVVVLPIVNISAGGILLRIDRDLAGVGVDEQVSVFLDITDIAEPIMLTMDATVVRVIAGETSTSIALMWTSTSGEAVGKLAKLLDHLRDA
jgi:hypothetical protein